MDTYFNTQNLAVGYHGKALIHDINIAIEKGKILTLIGPNGAGKSTILKSIIKQIPFIGGSVFIDRQQISDWTAKDMAKKLSVVLTERIRPELMTCAEVVAMGRYPYTNMIGKLSAHDKALVQESLAKVHALDLANQDFLTLSDGQKQRIMLARAICQEPEVLILDEPTAYLDIRHKIELLDILREMAQEKQITIIMSLHEIDLATKISDYLMCVKGETIEAFGPPEEILKEDTIEKLYDLQKGSYNLMFGSVELTKTAGLPKVFVIAGSGYGIPCYRALQKKTIPFATGILFQNDVDYQVAKDLSNHVVTAQAFEPITETQIDDAAKILCKCKTVIDAGTPIGTYNQGNQKLLQLAYAQKIPVLSAREFLMK